MTALQNNTLDWTQVYFTAEAEREPFEDVNVITAKAEYVNRAELAAVELLMEQKIECTAQNVSRLSRTLIATSKVFVQEFVRIDEDGTITVCIDVPDLQDDLVMWRALDYVAKALDQLDNKEGTVYFGEPIRFPVSIVPWVITN